MDGTWLSLGAVAAVVGVAAVRGRGSASTEAPTAEDVLALQYQFGPFGPRRRLSPRDRDFYNFPVPPPPVVIPAWVYAEAHEDPSWTAERRWAEAVRSLRDSIPASFPWVGRTWFDDRPDRLVVEDMERAYGGIVRWKDLDSGDFPRWRYELREHMRLARARILDLAVIEKAVSSALEVHVAEMASPGFWRKRIVPRIHGKKGSGARRKPYDPTDPYFEYKVNVERSVTFRQRATLVVVAQNEAEAKSIARDRMMWEGNDERHPKIDWTPNPYHSSVHSGDKQKVRDAGLVSGKRVYPGIPRITGKKTERSW